MTTITGACVPAIVPSLVPAPTEGVDDRLRPEHGEADGPAGPDLGAGDPGTGTPGAHKPRAQKPGTQGQRPWARTSGVRSGPHDLRGLRILHLTDTYRAPARQRTTWQPQPWTGSGTHRPRPGVRAATGVERLVAALAHAQAELGAVVAVAAAWATPGQDGLVEVVTVPAAPPALGALQASRGERSLQLQPSLADPVTTWGLRRFADRFEPDVVIAHSWMLLSWLAVRHRYLNTRTIGYAHDYGLFRIRRPGHRHVQDCAGRGAPGPGDGQNEFQTTAGAAAQGAGLAALRQRIRRIDGLAAVSASVARAVGTALCIDPPHVVPPLISLPEASSAAPRPGFLPAEPFALYTGRIAPHRGVAALLDAFDVAKDLSLVLLGEAPSGWRPPEGSGIVVRHGASAEERLAAWAHATVGVLPGPAGDPMPLSALEAILSGCPLVAEGAGGILDLVEQGVTGLLVPPGDTISLLRTARYLVRDQHTRACMAAATRKMSENLGAERIMEDWAGLIGAVCGPRSGRRNSVILPSTAKDPAVRA
ncbi:MAG: hypothetical protein QG608_2273 [Actinomycetota bacterium]|nr:hypothetical protein [Actinomycetota bacterium]